MKTYHNDYEYLSKSFLQQFATSPAHAKHYMDNKLDTDAMRFGRIYHAMIAGAADEYVVFDPDLRPEPDKTFGSKLNKEWKEGFAIANDGKDVCSIDELKQFETMIQQLRANEVVQQINAFDLVQEEAFRTEIDGYKVKCKPDGLQIHRGENKENLVIDWKTCTSVHPDKIRYDMIKYGYDVQAALYTDIISEINGGESNFMFIFQEKTEPYDVLPVLVMSYSDVMKDGRNKWRNYYIQARRCLDANVWPGVADQFKEKCLIIE